MPAINIFEYSGQDGMFIYVDLTLKGNKVLSKVFPHWQLAQDQVKKILGEELDLFQKNLKHELAKVLKNHPYY